MIIFHSIKAALKNLNELKSAITVKDEWCNAEGENEGKIFFLRYRPHIKSFCDLKIFVKRVVILWNYRSDDLSLLPGKPEFELMEKFENSIVWLLEEDLQAILSFVYTGQQRREWHFYSKDNVEETKNRINQIKSNLYPIDITVDRDPYWKEYNLVLEGAKMP